MNKALKYALISAGVVFVAGVSVGACLAIKNKKDSSKTNTEIELTPEGNNDCCGEFCECENCLAEDSDNEETNTEE